MEIQSQNLDARNIEQVEVLNLGSADLNVFFKNEGAKITKFEKNETIEAGGTNYYKITFDDGDVVTLSIKNGQNGQSADIAGANAAIASANAAAASANSAATTASQVSSQVRDLAQQITQQKNEAIAAMQSATTTMQNSVNNAINGISTEIDSQMSAIRSDLVGINEQLESVLYGND